MLANTSGDDLEKIAEQELEEELLLEAIEDEISSNMDISNDFDNSSSENQDENEEKKMHKTKKKKRLKGELKARTVILLILALLVNTYAWFIYISTVSSSIDVHIKSWDFELSNGDLDENYTFAVEQIYPGMEDVSQTISAKNNGETAAKLVCDITSLTIFNTKYVVADEDGEYDTDDDDGRLTLVKIESTEELIKKLQNEDDDDSDYFTYKIEIYINDELYDGTSVIMQTGDESTIEYRISWDYEQEAEDSEELAKYDAIDTAWGEEAYSFYEEYGTEGYYCIVLNLHVKAVQATDEEVENATTNTTTEDTNTTG